MKKKILSSLVLIIAVAAIVVLSQSFYTVKPNEYANTLRFSKTISTKSEPGLYMKIPFIDSVKYFPKQVLLYDMMPSDVLTADSKTMEVDNYVTWKITDPLKFYKTLGSITEAESRINMLTYSAIRSEMGLMQRDAIISSDESSREKFNQNVIDATKDATDSYGIEIIDIKIKKLDLPEDNEEAVYNRMISERNKEAAKIRAEGERVSAETKSNIDKTNGIELSNAQRDAELTKAEGEKAYLETLASAYDTADKQKFYEFIRALDALKASLNNETTIILGKDSVIAQALTNP